MGCPRWQQLHHDTAVFKCVFGLLFICGIDWDNIDIVDSTHPSRGQTGSDSGLLEQPDIAEAWSPVRYGDDCSITVSQPGRLSVCQGFHPPHMTPEERGCIHQGTQWKMKKKKVEWKVNTSAFFWTSPSNVSVHLIDYDPGVYHVLLLAPSSSHLSLTRYKFHTNLRCGIILRCSYHGPFSYLIYNFRTLVSIKKYLKKGFDETLNLLLLAHRNTLNNTFMHGKKNIKRKYVLKYASYIWEIAKELFYYILCSGMTPPPMMSFSLHSHQMTFGSVLWSWWAS